MNLRSAARVLGMSRRRVRGLIEDGTIEADRSGPRRTLELLDSDVWRVRAARAARKTRLANRRARWIELYRAGWAFAEIARECGCAASGQDRKHVRGLILTALGRDEVCRREEARRHARAARPQQLAERLRELRAQGLSLTAAASRLRISVSWASRVLNATAGAA